MTEKTAFFYEKKAYIICKTILLQFLAAEMRVQFFKMIPFQHDSNVQHVFFHLLQFAQMSILTWLLCKISFKLTLEFYNTSK